MAEIVKVVEQKNNLIISSPGPQGPRGRTILSGNGSPSSNLGLEGDFYYDKTSFSFYGPKPSNVTWSGSDVVEFATTQNVSFSTSWELSQIVGPINGEYSIQIIHNLGYSPSVTIKSSSGDVVETGINYDSLNELTLVMAQPFSGTVYLS
jgi:hypothetical protein